MRRLEGPKGVVVATWALMLVPLCAPLARADLRGLVYRIEYRNTGVEDCLRFFEDGAFMADSSLALPAGVWAQRGPLYTAHQSDASGNTFAWGGVEIPSPDDGRLLGAFVSSLGIRLGFEGRVDLECQVEFEEVSGPRKASYGDDVTYEIRSQSGEVTDCLRLAADGRFTSDRLSAQGLPPGAWHVSGISLSAFQSGVDAQGFTVNSFGGALLAGGGLWLAVDGAGRRTLGRRTAACEVDR